METNKLILNASVLHKVFGKGLVQEFDGGFITINFNEVGSKKFVYPDAFENFLEISDDHLIELVNNDLASKKADIEAERDILRQKYEEVKTTKVTVVKKKRTTTKKK